MTPPPTPAKGQRASEQGVAAPAARWSGAGFLAGAGAVGILWGTVGRTPPPQPIHANPPAEIREQAAADATPPTIAPPPAAEPLPLVPPAPRAQLVQAEPEPQPPSTPTRATPATDPEARPAQQPTSQPASPVLTRININTAGPAELDTLPRIGPALAQRIIDFRDANGPFRSLQDLERVSGIGPKTVERLAPHITFD